MQQGQARFFADDGLPTYGIDKKSFNTVIKGLKGVIEKVYDVQMDYGRYMETRTLYVAHLAGWDMILGKPVLTALNALIPADQTLLPSNLKGWDASHSRNEGRQGLLWGKLHLLHSQ